MAIDTSAWIDIQLDPLSPPPEDFDGLSVDDAAELIKGWFLDNFEDPVRSCRILAGRVAISTSGVRMTPLK
jgi:hypothetical protein